jgi:hypothetical protein
LPFANKVSATTLPVLPVAPVTTYIGFSFPLPLLLAARAAAFY